MNVDSRAWRILRKLPGYSNEAQNEQSGSELQKIPNVVSPGELGRKLGTYRRVAGGDILWFVFERGIVSAVPSRSPIRFSEIVLCDAGEKTPLPNTVRVTLQNGEIQDLLVNVEHSRGFSDAFSVVRFLNRVLEDSGKKHRQ